MAKKPSTAAAPEEGGEGQVTRLRLRPIRKRHVEVTIRGLEGSPLVTHKWDEKARAQMRGKHAGKKTKERAIRDPEAEFLAATYFTAGGEYGMPCMALKKSILNAAHKDLGVERTLVAKALFIKCDDPNLVLKLDCEPPVMREDCVRLNRNATDLRYRPEYNNWSCRVLFEVDAELLWDEDLLNLIDRAGFGVGVCEYRPEKHGDWGRFEVDRSVPIGTKDL